MAASSWRCTAGPSRPKQPSLQLLRWAADPILTGATPFMSTTVGTGSSRSLDERVAVNEAAAKALGRMADGAPDLVTLYASTVYDPGKLLAAAQARFGA